MNSKNLFIFAAFYVVLFLQISYGELIVSPFTNTEDCPITNCDEYSENSYLKISGGSLSSLATPYCLVDESGAQSCSVEFTYTVTPDMSLGNLVALTSICTDKDIKNVHDYPVAFQGPFEEGQSVNLTYSIPIEYSKEYDESQSGMRYGMIQTIFRSLDSEQVGKCYTKAMIINQNDPNSGSI